MFVGNELHGFGRSFNRETNVLYVGMWEKDKWHGPGKLTVIYGDTYEGEFHQGMKHGPGKMTLANSDFFVG